MDRIVRVVGHDGSATLYEYDAIGNRTKVRHEGGLTVSYRYDECSRLVNETVTDTDGSILMYYGYTYSDAGEKTSVTEMSRESSDDTDARVTYTQYSYDSLSRFTGETIRVKDGVNFAGLDFDDITSGITWAGSITYLYGYDAASNRASKTVSVTGDACGLDEDIQTGTTGYAYNVLNQLITSTYDIAGQVRLRFSGEGFDNTAN